MAKPSRKLQDIINKVNIFPEAFIKNTYVLVEFYKCPSENGRNGQ